MSEKPRLRSSAQLEALRKRRKPWKKPAKKLQEDDPGWLADQQVQRRRKMHFNPKAKLDTSQIIDKRKNVFGPLVKAQRASEMRRKPR